MKRNSALRRRARPQPLRHAAAARRGRLAARPESDRRHQRCAGISAARTAADGTDRACAPIRLLVRRVPQRALAGAGSCGHGDALGVGLAGAAHDDGRRYASREAHRLRRSLFQRSRRPPTPRRPSSSPQPAAGRSGRHRRPGAGAAPHGAAPPLGLRSGLPPGIFDVNLANLPRLPDTAEELRAIAAALGVDPATTLKLGKDANERVVKATKLSAYRIVAFATHGLMADDIDGLDQPALALTAPRVAGITGTGFLTMEDILTLKLNADWVMLSACNTGAGAGEGAEAASGLGRAFFYAGARTLLVTNWSVHSQSARALIADVFRRQASDPKLTRTEALRRAMMGLLDGPGFVGRYRPDPVHLCASAVLGTLFGHRRRRRNLTWSLRAAEFAERMRHQTWSMHQSGATHDELFSCAGSGSRRCGRRRCHRSRDRAAQRRSRRLRGPPRAAPCPNGAWSGPSSSSTISGRSSSAPARASTCGRIPISGSPPSRFCSTARSCIATVSAAPRPFIRATST